jgi:hypothetical protein
MKPEILYVAAAAAFPVGFLERPTHEPDGGWPRERALKSEQAMWPCGGTAVFLGRLAARGDAIR